MTIQDTRTGSDGRKRRSERSRQQIIEALLDIIRSGEMNPSARTVAHRADVSLRTVYRLFEDLEALYRAVAAHVEDEFMPRVQAPFEETSWPARFEELVRRRAAIYEELLLLKTVASVRRFSSALLMQYHQRFIELEHEAMARALADLGMPSPISPEVMDVFVNFETWRRLREDLGLSVVEAQNRWLMVVTVHHSAAQSSAAA